MASDTYQIYAVRYAHNNRPARENFLQGDPHDTAPRLFCLGHRRRQSDVCIRHRL